MIHYQINTVWAEKHDLNTEKHDFLDTSKNSSVRCSSMDAINKDWLNACWDSMAGGRRWSKRSCIQTELYLASQTPPCTPDVLSFQGMMSFFSSENFWNVAGCCSKLQTLRCWGCCSKLQTLRCCEVLRSVSCPELFFFRSEVFHALKWVFHLFFFKFVDRWERENEYWSLLRECLQPSNLLSKWPPFKSREYVIVKQKFTSCLWVVSNAFNAFHELRFFQICWALRELNADRWEMGTGLLFFFF